MDRIELAKLLKERCGGRLVIQPWGQPVAMFDRKMIGKDPILLSRICNHMAKNISEETEIIAGIGKGGIDIASGIAKRTGKRLIVLQKNNLGELVIDDNLDIRGINIVLVDDIVCRGDKAILAKKIVEKCYPGCRVNDLSVVVSRGNVFESRLNESGIRVRALFNGEELREV